MGFIAITSEGEALDYILKKIYENELILNGIDIMAYENRTL